MFSYQKLLAQANGRVKADLFRGTTASFVVLFQVLTDIVVTLTRLSRDKLGKVLKFYIYEATPALQER